MNYFGLRIADFGFRSARQVRNPQSKGFTLLEVMIAVSIMAMVLVTMLGLKNRTMQDVALADRITTATLLAKRVMTETLLNKPTKPFEDAGEFPEDDYKDYTWKMTVAPFSEPMVPIMEVHVAVLWKEGTREETVELVSYE
jgi:general secretion pathway protein I